MINMKRLLIMVLMLCIWGHMLQVPAQVLDSAQALVADVYDSVAVEQLSNKQIQQVEVESGDTMLYDTQEESMLLKANTNDTIRLAIMLPFQTDAQKATESQIRYVDFYTGALIAIYEAQKTGKYIEVQTYDVGKTAQGVQTVMESENWKKVDGIIGPAYEKQIQKALEYAIEDSIWILAPFVSDLTFEQDYKFVFQFNSTDKSHAEVFANYLSTKADTINCILVQPEEGEVVPGSVEALREVLQKYEISTTTPTMSEILHDSLEYYLVENRENIIVFNTEKFMTLSTVMPHLEMCSRNHNNLTLYSRYSWMKNPINIPQIYTCIFSNGGRNTVEFSKLYKRFFTKKPLQSLPRYDLLGYDLTKQFITILSNPTIKQIEETFDGTQSKIRYRKSFDHSGYENRMIRVIRK
jgi:hypothetical protein